MTFTLCNCTVFQLQYKVIITGGHWHQVAPGSEGKAINHKTLFTLRTERTDDKSSTGTRAAVHPNGTYYAVYVGGKIKILNHDQASNFAKNDDNRYIVNWFPEQEIKHINEDVLWMPILSRVNKTGTKLSFNFVEKLGLVEKTSSTHRLIIQESKTSDYKVGADFIVKGVNVSGEIGGSSGSHKEHFEEKISEQEIYETKEEHLSLDLEPNKSVVVWQPYTYIFGHKVMFDHLEYRTQEEGKPDDIQFNPASFGFEYFLT